MGVNDKSLKLYYSIGEVAQMVGVNETTLRFWEREFPQIRPKRVGRDIRQYRREDLDVIKMVHHLIKEQGMTIPGARQRLKDSRGRVERKMDVLERLKSIRQELIGMRDALDAFTYTQLDTLRENINDLQGESDATEV